jgi:hypothetical protein
MEVVRPRSVEEQKDDYLALKRQEATSVPLEHCQEYFSEYL